MKLSCSELPGSAPLTAWPCEGSFIPTLYELLRIEVPGREPDALELFVIGCSMPSTPPVPVVNRGPGRPRMNECGNFFFVFQIVEQLAGRG